MKKISIFLLTLLAIAVSCNKEIDIDNETQSDTISIAATIIKNDAKATYTDKGIFSWENGDEISYILRHDDGYYNCNTLTTSGSGSTATFTGSTTASNYSPVNLAFYPKNRGGEPSENNLNVVYNAEVKTLRATLAGTITAKTDRLSRIIPMIGKKTGEDPSGKVENYHFYPVTGVLKLSFTNLPSTASQIRLEVPDAATYPLNGTFSIDTERAIPEIKKTDVVTGYREKWLNFTHSASNDIFYVPLPTGTIPAGALTVALTDGTNILYSVTNKQDITLTRGEITALPSITIPSIKVKLSGTPTAPKATFYFSGEVAKVKYGKTMTLNYGPSIDVTTSGTTVDLPHDFNYKYPLQYQAYNSSDETIGDLEILYFYTLTDTGISEVCKQFTSATTDIGLSGSKTPSLTNNDPFSATTPTITFAVSDDITKGNIIVTEFCGVSGKVYGSYVDYQTASGTPVQDFPQITINNEVFCTAGGNNYNLTEASYSGARFAVKTTKKGTPNVYGVNGDLVCWGEYVGLHNGTGWGPFVQWFFDPE